VRACVKVLILLMPFILAGCGISSLEDNAFGVVIAQEAQQSAPVADAPAQGSGALDKAAQNYASMADPKSKSYKIGPLDVLEITVFNVPELSKSAQVSDTGTIKYPLIGEVQAGGKTPREVERDLTAKLGGKYLKNPQITVFVKDYNSQRVTVTGAVKKPGVVPMAGGTTLMQAIAQAGGLDEMAESTAVIFRASEGKRAGQRYDLSDLDSGTGNDPQLLTGDVIVVPVSNIKYGMGIMFKMLPLASIAPQL
jgi:polysaccharide biosynthesis/export protein